jgi:hypothetical protein
MKRRELSLVINLAIVFLLHASWAGAEEPRFSLAACLKRQTWANLENAKTPVWLSMSDKIRADLEKRPSSDQRYFKYFYFDSHLIGDGAVKDLKTQRDAFFKVLNMLSSEKELHLPADIDGTGRIYCVDIRKVGWDPYFLWPEVQKMDSHQTIYDLNSNAEFFKKNSGEAFPGMSGGQFVAKALNSDAYPKIMRFPNALFQLENELGVNLNSARTTAIRAGTTDSGVSVNNRVVERVTMKDGRAYWKTFDFKEPVGNDNRNIFEHPADFQADGGEVIYELPNGMHAYALFDNQDRFVKKAPTEIVSDPLRRDRAVENAISCVRCHANGFLMVNDELREFVENSEGHFNESVIKKIKLLHPDVDSFKDVMEKDNQKYRETLARLNIDPKKPDPISPLIKRHEQNVSLETAAAELGVTQDKLQRYLLERRSELPELARLASGGSVPRAVFERTVFQVKDVILSPSTFFQAFPSASILKGDSSEWAQLLKNERASFRSFRGFNPQHRAFLVRDRYGVENVVVGRFVSDEKKIRITTSGGGVQSYAHDDIIASAPYFEAGLRRAAFVVSIDAVELRNLLRDVPNSFRNLVLKVLGHNHLPENKSGLDQAAARTVQSLRVIQADPKRPVNNVEIYKLLRESLSDVDARKMLQVIEEFQEIARSEGPRNY